MGRVSTTSYSYTLLAGIPSPGTQHSEQEIPVSTFNTRICAILFFLLPSFVQKWLRPEFYQNRRRLHPTSWLDGLRGVASLFVFLCHYTEGTNVSYTLSYGVHLDGDDVTSSPLQLPFIRVIYGGRPMVHIFFIISGFVLSYKPLKQIRAGQFDSVQRTLASSVFRRGFRLFLPTTVSTFSIMLLIYYGHIKVDAKSTLWAQFWDWCGEVHNMLNISWAWDALVPPRYDVHLWTIPVEMSFSMFLFVVITGLSRVKAFLRPAMVASLMVYCMRSGHWAGFEFLAGMGLAEMQLIQDARAQKLAALAQETEQKGLEESVMTPSSDTRFSRPRLAKFSLRLFLFGNMLFGLFVAGWPNHKAEVSPGFSTLYANTMQPYLGRGAFWPSFPWYSLAALQIVVALQQITPLQRIFTTKTVQYLADISYSIYICHGPVMKSIHWRCMPLIWQMVSGGEQHAGMWGRLIAWLIGLVAMAIPVFWVSDVFWRAVDLKCVELAKYIESICFIDV